MKLFELAPTSRTSHRYADNDTDSELRTDSMTAGSYHLEAKSRFSLGDGQDAAERQFRLGRDASPEFNGGCRDALLELARENLILRQHLNLANTEVEDSSVFSNMVQVV